MDIIDVDVDLDQRPFAIDPITRLMSLDGAFVKGLTGDLSRMRARFPNPVATRRPNFKGRNYPIKVSVRDTFAATIGIVPDDEAEYFNSDQNHFYFDFALDLSNAREGKHRLQFDLQIVATLISGPLGPNSMINVLYRVRFNSLIFVIDVNFDAANLSGVASVEEGALRWTLKGVQVFRDNPLSEDNLCKNRSIFLPNEYVTKVVFRESFSGTHGPLPLSDPWWKVLGLIVAIVCGLVAAVWLIGGLLGAWDFPIKKIESGALDPVTGQACTGCEPSNYSSYETDPVRGGFLTAALLGAGAFEADMIDVYRKGEATVPPESNDKTVSEFVKVKLKYDELPLPGTPFKLKGTSLFQRQGKNNTHYPYHTEQRS